MVNGQEAFSRSLEKRDVPLFKDSADRRIQPARNMANGDHGFTAPRCFHCRPGHIGILTCLSFRHPRRGILGYQDQVHVILSCQYFQASRVRFHQVSASPAVEGISDRGKGRKPSSQFNLGLRGQGNKPKGKARAFSLSPTLARAFRPIASVLDFLKTLRSARVILPKAFRWG